MNRDNVIRQLRALLGDEFRAQVACAVLAAWHTDAKRRGALIALARELATVPAAGVVGDFEK